MTDKKITALSADTNPSVDDLAVIVNDPLGTPETRNVTLSNLFSIIWAAVTNAATVKAAPRLLDKISIVDSEASNVIKGVKLSNLFPFFLKNYLTGLTLANNGSDATNDIDIAAGTAADSTNVYMIVLTAALTKRLDAAWAVGTNQGGLDTGSIANTTYHMWLIARSDTGVADVLFSASASAPTMPANYDYKRRIGAIVRTGGAIKAFIQDGDDFIWKVPNGDINATNPGTSAVTATLTLPVGIRIKAYVTFGGYGTVNTDNPQYIFLSDLSITDTAAAIGSHSGIFYNSAAVLTQGGGQASIWTSTAAQIRYRASVSTAATHVYISTNGWMDRRGRDG